MRPTLRRPYWPAAILIAVAASLAVPSALAAQATPGAASLTAPPRTAVARQVFLIDGSQLVIHRLPDGSQETAIRPGGGLTSVLALRIGNRVQELPALALPYLGRGLDPSLFALGPLERAESSGRLPVQVTFSGRAPALPGITVTRTGPGTEQGYLTASGAVAFGAALTRQFRADHARASYGHDGMFADGVDIKLAGAPTAHAARPTFRLHTLTMAATNLSGHPDTGDLIFVFNEDNPARFGDFEESINIFDHGTAKFSVPAGHYWAIGDFFSFSRRSAAERLVVLPQFTVRHRATIHLSARAATSEVGFTTPRPAKVQVAGFTVIRGARNGATFSFGFFGSGSSLWVSPTTRRPSVGTLRSFTSGQLTSSRTGANASYVYNLNYEGPPGIIPARQHFDATPATLATVTAHYVQDVPSTGGWGVFGGFRPELTGLLIAQIFPFSLPRTQTQYFTAGPSQAWSAFYFEFTTFSSFGGGQFDAFRSFSGGQRLTVNWNAYPLHPQPDVQVLRGPLGAAVPVLPSAFRTGNTLFLGTAPFSDNYPGHLGIVVFSRRVQLAGSYAIYQNGKLIAHGSPLLGIGPVQLSSTPSVIKFVLSEGRFGAAFPLSTAARTAWTWRSAPRPGATVPPSWLCFTRTFGTTRQCAVQPMMTLRYHVQGLPADGRAPAGPQVIWLDVGHLQLGRTARITGASSQVSYNDGQSFEPASVASQGDGHFRISFNAPAGVDVTLRVRATDAARGSITETILRAYGVAS